MAPARGVPADRGALSVAATGPVLEACQAVLLEPSRPYRDALGPQISRDPDISRYLKIRTLCAISSVRSPSHDLLKTLQSSVCDPLAHDGGQHHDSRDEDATTKEADRRRRQASPAAVDGAAEAEAAVMRSGWLSANATRLS